MFNSCTFRGSGIGAFYGYTGWCIWRSTRHFGSWEVSSFPHMFRRCSIKKDIGIEKKYNIRCVTRGVIHGPLGPSSLLPPGPARPSLRIRFDYRRAHDEPCFLPTWSQNGPALALAIGLTQLCNFTPSTEPSPSIHLQGLNLPTDEGTEVRGEAFTITFLSSSTRRPRRGLFSWPFSGARL